MDLPEKYKDRIRIVGVKFWIRQYLLRSNFVVENTYEPRKDRGLVHETHY
jgi:hypothetical protein